MKLSKVALRLLNISIIAMVWLLAILFLYRVGLYAYNFGYRVYTEPPMSSVENSRDMLVTINDTDLSTVAEIIYEKGLVDDQKLFYLQLLISQAGVKDSDKNKIKAGVYTMNTAMTYKEIIATMCYSEEEG